MAKSKWATVTDHVDLGEGVHRVTVEADEDIHHVAGNYVILRSTLTNPDKPEDVLKRAYSISTPPDPDRPRHFSFTIVSVGSTSAWLAARTPGDRVEFSGPWGRKFRAQPDDPAGPVHLFATGTGWSPIGAMARVRHQSDGGVVGVWWQVDQPYDADVLEQLSADPRFTVTTGPSVEAQVPADPEALYFLAGDGHAVLPLAQRLVAAGVPAAQVRTEYFFHKPPKPK